jgi:ribose transport system substrate-binding protein
MKKVMGILVLVALAVVLTTIGCKQKEETKTTKFQIAVIPKGTTHVFWKSIHAGAIKAEQELKAAGVDVEVIWKGPLKEDDREEQIKVVEGFGGRKGGKRLAEILGGKGKVILLRYQEGSASTMNREQGFLDVLKEEYPDIEVVSSSQYGGATTESAYIASENLLSPLRTPEGGLTIDGIFCPNESTTFAMLRALEDGGLAGKVKFVGFDSSERLVKGLEDREIHGLVLQDPINMGYLGVKTMVAHLQGQSVEKRIDTGSDVATPENMDDPKMKNLLEPDIKKWLNE